ncbi:putative glycolipid-binding domain-containing protein [Chitinophaga agri]|uniref:Putative glycolipid-binding domain-containing protein n=1 Tax=Chitinophaga agri TaxID=2703787 RepID=A0A6B9ZDK6_9BACT|nr:putative glycolipid-binding domain-containing protein [Chitinophaga agri]QHS58593.1 putative glycolipid-binding domain-containing protein [Chitinophaga agri]
MRTQRILWKGIYYNTLEYLHIQSDTTHDIQGNITGLVKDLPIHVQYKISTNAQWEVQTVIISILEHGENTLQLTRANDRWQDKQGTVHAIFDDCTDIDISLTPFTNTLPINRLSLAIGASADIAVVYFDLPGMDIKPARQRYSRLSATTYRYESLTSGFTAELEVDEAGLVINYPEIWERIATHIS